MDKNLHLFAATFNMIRILRGEPMLRYSGNSTELPKEDLRTTFEKEIDNALYASISILDTIGDMRESTVKFIKYCSDGKRDELIKLLEESNSIIKDIKSKNEWTITTHLETEGIINIHACNEEGLRCAASNGHYQIIELLFEKVECAHTSGIGLVGALVKGIKNKHFQVVKVLLDYGLEIETYYDELIKLTDDSDILTLLESYKPLSTIF
jgi:hypothetical protein